MKNLKDTIKIDEGVLITLKMPTILFYDIYNILCDIREKKWNKLQNYERENNVDMVQLSQDFHNSVQHK